MRAGRRGERKVGHGEGDAVGVRIAAAGPDDRQVVAARRGVERRGNGEGGGPGTDE